MVDHWSFWKNLGLCSRTFLSILVVTMGQWVPTQTAQFSCLLARCFGSSLWCELVHSSYRRVYSAKVANPYMGARSTQRQRRPLLPPVLAWRDRNASYLWTTSFLALIFACLTLLATEPKLGIRGRRNWSWLEMLHELVTGGVKEVESNRSDWEHRSNYLDKTLIDRTKCSANNFLDVCER